jgi:3-oxoacyl-[acyl-carrier-protein] synthase II
MDGVVITGTGAVSLLGTGVPRLIGGLLGNEVAVRTAPWVGPGAAPVAWWTAVPDFRPLEWMTDQVEAGTDLFAQFALAAAEQAIQQAGLKNFDPRRTAVVHGTSMGGMRALLKGQHQLDIADPQLDPVMLAEVLGAMVDQTCYIWFFLGKEFDSRVVVDSLTLVWSRAIGVPAA